MFHELIILVSVPFGLDIVECLAICIIICFILWILSASDILCTCIILVLVNMSQSYTFTYVIPV